MLRVSILFIALTGCAITDTIAWRNAVLCERDETMECLRMVCDNTMTVEHCFELAESLCL